ASSLVSYSIGIVDIDPIRYGLYFERFLNPSRKTMPDIDTDFEDTKREAVIKYVQKKYGETHVSLIGTYQTFLAKSCIRDIAKSLNIPQEKVNLIAKEISRQNSIDELLNNKKIKQYYSADEDIKNILDISKAIEGLPRSIGVHASGVIICDRDLRDFSEVHKDQSGIIVTTYDADSLKELNLLKMDFLALKNLSIIHDILNDIKEFKGEEINISKIDKKDPLTFELLNTKSTTGIFQLESPGMERLLKNMHVKDIEDLALCISLFRPGPMDSIPLYLKRRKGEEKIDYYDNSIKSLLEETLGIIVYQEQAMSVLSRYAGLTLADADIVRRAMSSKDAKLMEGVKKRFFEGANKMGRDIKTTEKIFDAILKFSEYGLNKAHAVSYAHISYELSYLKAHYKAEFMANLLKNSSDIKYIKECASLNIKILPPDLRYSSYRYRTINSDIVMPYTSIKGIGINLSKEIVRIASESNYKFEEFVRNSKSSLPRSLIESLILSGVFDYTTYNKKTMIESLDGLYEFDPTLIKGINEYTINKIEEYDFSYLKEMEKELLGFNPKYHPIKMYKGNLMKLSDLYEKPAQSVRIVAYVSDLKELKTKNNDYMASLIIEDEFKSMRAVIFPNNYLKFEHFLAKDKLYEIFGELKDNRGGLELIVRDIKLING
nr:DNA polymerase III subunit alpha [Gammaproteobacteria bacterium]